MPLNQLIMIVVLSAAVYRVGRFVVLDTMWEQTRAKMNHRLLSSPRPFWHKIHELLGCPFCITVWIAAAACLAWRIFVAPFPAPVFVWLAVSAGALIFWRIVDWEPDEE